MHELLTWQQCLHLRGSGSTFDAVKLTSGVLVSSVFNKGVHFIYFVCVGLMGIYKPNHP